MKKRIKCSYLFHHYRKVRSEKRMGLHVHPFWQIHFIMKNKVELQKGKVYQVILPNSFILLPPKSKHSFIYKFGSVECLAISFLSDISSLKNIGVFPFSHSVLTDSICNSAKSFLKMERRPSLNECQYIESLLAHLLKEILPQKKEYPTLKRKILDFINKNNTKRIRVSDVANQLNFSESYVRAKFRSESGVSLKSFLDQERYAKVKQMLTYSDLSISQISTEYDFPDVYSFSRFFKHHFGKSPRAYKNELSQTEK